MKYAPHITMLLGGTLFGFGLAYSGAARPEVVLSFLRMQDLGLLLVIGVALVVTLAVFQIVPRVRSVPPFGAFYDGYDGFPITKRSVVGAVLFGIGWGVSGLCPATALAAIGMGNVPVLVGIFGIFTGTFIYGTIRSRGPKE